MSDEVIQDAISQRDELLARVKMLEDALRKVEEYAITATAWGRR